MIKGWIVFSSTASVKTLILHLLGKLLLKCSSKKEKELKIPLHTDEYMHQPPLPSKGQ